jgi:hypothetical protein
MADNTTDLNGADKVVAQSPRNGFETQFQLDKIAIASYARVAALDVNGTIIGSTPAVDTKTYKLIKLDYDIDEVKSLESKTIDSAIPSSAKVIVPVITKPGGGGGGDEEEGEENVSSKGSSVSHALMSGGVAGFIIGSAAFL